MSVVAIPNISEGRRTAVIDACIRRMTAEGPRVLDVHSDPVHDRTVLTVHGEDLVAAMASLADEARRRIDLTVQRGLHPRVGALDVCPFVPIDDAGPPVELARRAGAAIHAACGAPVYFYGSAAFREETRELPDIRSGGLARLRRRARDDLPPDIGGPEIDPHTGAICVGARMTLIAFNVMIAGPVEVANGVARAIRAKNHGLIGVRALGIEIGPDVAQVSMNLTDPDRVGVEEVFEAVGREARRAGVDIRATELVGLVPERHLPPPDAEAARLLVEPGRSLEAALTG